MERDEYEKKLRCARNGCEQCKDELNTEYNARMTGRTSAQQREMNRRRRVNYARGRDEFLVIDEVLYAGIDPGGLISTRSNTKTDRMGINPSGEMKEKKLMTDVREKPRRYQAFRFTGIDSVEELTQLGLEHNVAVFYRKPIAPVVKQRPNGGVEILSNGVTEALGFQAGSDYDIEWLAVDDWVFLDESTLRFVRKDAFERQYEVDPEAKKK